MTHTRRHASTIIATFVLGAFAQGCTAAATVKVPVLAAPELRAENVDYVALLPEVYWDKHKARGRNEGLEMTAAIIGAVKGNRTPQKTGGDTSFEDSPMIAGYMAGELQTLSSRHGLAFHNLRDAEDRPEGHGVGIKMSKLLVSDDRLMTGNMPVKPRYTATVQIIDLAGDSRLHEEVIKCTEHKVPDCKAWIAHAMSIILLPDVVDLSFGLVDVAAMPALEAAVTSAESGAWDTALAKYTEAVNSGTQLTPEDAGGLQWNLGVARFATGDCAGARTAWDEAIKASVERRDWYQDYLATVPAMKDGSRCGVKVLSPDAK